MVEPLSFTQALVIILLYLAGCAWVGLALVMALLKGSETSALFDNGHLALFFVLVAGMALHIFALFLCGLFGQLHTKGIAGSAAFLVIGATFLIVRPATPANWKVLEQFIPRGPAVFIWAANAALILSLFAYAVSFAMQAPGRWDDTSYHLPYARYYLEQHALVMNGYLRFPLFPNNMELLYAFGLSIGRVVGAQALSAVPVAIAAIGLIGGARQFLGSAMAGLLAAGLLFYLGPVRYTLGYAYVDNGVLLFCWAALLCLLQIADKGNRPDSAGNGWVILAAILAATASGVKLFGAVFSVMLILFVLVQTRRLRSAAVFALILGFIGSWWYVRSMWVSGDPIHPAGGSLLGYFLWDQQDLISQQTELASHSAGMSPVRWWSALEKAEVTAIAPAFFALLFLRRGERPLLLAYFLLWIYFIFWVIFAQVDRYLMPVLALACFFTGLVFSRAVLSPLRTVVVARWPRVEDLLQNAGPVVLLCIAVSVGWSSMENARSNLDRWSDVLESRAGYRLFKAANLLTPEMGARLLNLGFENAVFFYHGVAIGDWFGPGRYRQFLDCAGGNGCGIVDPETLQRMMQERSSRMVAINTDRFPIDVKRYLQEFDVRASETGGVLLTSKR